MPLHTDRQYEEELQHLRAQILEMGGLVEKQIDDALKALTERDSMLAQEVIERDNVVNHFDVAVDEACARLLALHQPAASDLRLVMTGLKVTTDLERVGDIARNICERALEMNEEPPFRYTVDLPRLGTLARSMLRDSLDAFVRQDPELGLEVCQQDATMDKLTSDIFHDMFVYMVREPASASQATRILFLAKYLERIADHATNIGEMVIYLVKGKSIRHMSPPPTAV